MSKYHDLRSAFLKTWESTAFQLSEELLFPIEKQFLSRVDSDCRAFFRPLHLPVDSSDQYQRVLGHIVDAVSLLPLRLDLAFDATWKALEGQLRTAGWNTTKKQRDMVMRAATNTIAPIALHNMGIHDAILKLFTLIPLQVCEFFAKNVREAFDANTGQLKQNHLGSRLRDSRLESFCDDLNLKYWSSTVSSNPYRDPGLLLQRLMLGESITLGKNAYTWSIEDRIHIFLAGPIYCFRNDRVHAASMPPFRSSQAGLHTYSMVHFMFLTTYAYVLIALLKEYPALFNAGDIEFNLNENIGYFETLYAPYLKS